MAARVPVITIHAPGSSREEEWKQMLLPLIDDFLKVLQDTSAYTFLAGNYLLSLSFYELKVKVPG